MTTLAVLLTCHNRKDKTLACLRALLDNELPHNVNLRVYVTDDGCTDGTADGVRQIVPGAEIIRMDGGAFWNGGMRVAFGKAMEADADFYLWLNDDTDLNPTALQLMLTTHAQLSSETHSDKHIVVGTTADRNSDRLTYGGLNRNHKFWRPVTFRLASPGNVASECDTMNGNCVLIPRSVAKLTGNLDPNFVHSMGDTDYGLRARHAGCKVWVASGLVGLCSHNDIKGTFVDREASVKQRLKRVLGPKGMPQYAWWTYVRRHGGALAPLLWLWPYLKATLVGISHTRTK
ncbi:MAG: glycosyltransferase family 2 protein [Accumulibacter sp.]|jgi:GT2 family glycosyltransferase